jgi:hypothetical protein
MQKTIPNTQLYLRFSKYTLLDNSNEVTEQRISEEDATTIRLIGTAIVKPFPPHVATLRYMAVSLLSNNV